MNHSMTNMNSIRRHPQVGALVMALASMGCMKKDPVITPIADVIVSVEPQAIPADSVSTTVLRVQLPNHWDIDQRQVTFRVESGTLLTTNQGTLQGQQYTTTVDAGGQASVRWRCTRAPGAVAYSVLTNNDAYFAEGRIATTTALPDAVLLTVPRIEYTSNEAVASITATLLKNEGYPCRGLPLTFQALVRHGADLVPAGNVLSPPTLLTRAAPAYTIPLELGVPGGPAAPDTVFVTAQCGTVVSPDTLRLFFEP